jgi:hypothetical protein
MKNAKEKTVHSILDMLLTHGLGGTLDYLCTFSAFSVLSEA